MKPNAFGITVATVLIVTTGFSALASPGSVTVYSNICYVPEAGDLIGTKIVVVDLGRDDIYVLYGTAQGGDPIPVNHGLNPDELKKFRNGRLEFDTDFLGPVQVRGTIVKDAIILTEGGFDGQDSSVKSPMRLNKIPLPQRFPECR